MLSFCVFVWHHSSLLKEMSGGGVDLRSYRRRPRSGRNFLNMPYRPLKNVFSKHLKIVTDLYQLKTYDRNMYFTDERAFLLNIPTENTHNRRKFD